MVAPGAQSLLMNVIEAVPFLLLCLIGLFVAGRFFPGLACLEVCDGGNDLTTDDL